MPYIIRNQQGVMVGHCTNKPGSDNKLPNGDLEIHDFYEENNTGKITEVTEFITAQEVVRNAPKTIAQKLARIGLTLEDLKVELSK